MRKILLLVVFISLFSSLYGYSKKIILGTFSTEENANKSIQIFSKTQAYKEFYKLSLEHHFNIYTRKSGNYHIVVAEPFVNRQVAIRALEIVEKEYPGAYANVYEVIIDELIQEAIKSIEVDLEHSEVVEEKEEQVVEEALVVKSERVIEKVIKEKALQENISKISTDKESEKSLEKTKEFAIDILEIFLYLTIALIIVIVLFFYKKMKILYNKY